MLEHGRDLEVSGEVLSRYADLTAEIESDSTLENVLRIKENGYFAGISFTAVDPLGIVAHPGHIERIEYLVRKVFGLPDIAVLRIVAPAIDKLSGGLSEHVMMPLTRLFFFGARSHVALRRRQHILAVGRNLIFSHRSAPGADASAADASGADA